jgi:hypothetical protein
MKAKRRIEFYARAEVAIVRKHGGAWAEEKLSKVLIAARQRYMNEEL